MDLNYISAFSSPAGSVSRRLRLGTTCDSVMAMQ